MSKMSESYLNKLVVVRNATGDIRGIGICISYTDRPTIGVNLSDGTQIDWIADLCAVYDIGEDAVDLLHKALKPQVENT